METVTDFTFLGSKITVDGDLRHVVKGHLLLGRKVMINVDSILKKQRHYFVNNGTPLQYSCLENPMDGGAWWAAVHGVAEGRT